MYHALTYTSPDSIQKGWMYTTETKMVYTYSTICMFFMLPSFLGYGRSLAVDFLMMTTVMIVRYLCGVTWWCWDTHWPQYENQPTTAHFTCLQLVLSWRAVCMGAVTVWYYSLPLGGYNLCQTQIIDQLSPNLSNADNMDDTVLANTVLDIIEPCNYELFPRCNSSTGLIFSTSVRNCAGE